MMDRFSQKIKNAVKKPLISRFSQKIKNAIKKPLISRLVGKIISKQYQTTTILPATKKKKLSIMLPHKDRSILLFKTIQVYQYFLKNKDIDYEILVGEDFSQPSELINLRALTGIKLCIVQKPHDGANAVASFQAMRKEATGDIFIISCAEVAPLNDVFIKYFRNIRNGQYIIGACYALSPIKTLKFILQPIEQRSIFNWFEDGCWYQHTKYRNTQYNFFTIITTNDFDQIGGFSSEYINYRGWEDVDFLNRIRAANIKLINDDSMLSVHMNHYGGLYTNGLDEGRRW